MFSAQYCLGAPADSIPFYRSLSSFQPGAPQLFQHGQVTDKRSILHIALFALDVTATVPSRALLPEVSLNDSMSLGVLENRFYCLVAALESGGKLV